MTERYIVVIKDGEDNKVFQFLTELEMNYFIMDLKVPYAYGKVKWKKNDT